MENPLKEGKVVVMIIDIKYKVTLSVKISLIIS